MLFVDAFVDGLGDDLLSFWPIVPGMSARDRLNALKRFGLYAAVLGFLVTRSVKSAAYGLLLTAVATVAWEFDRRYAVRRARGGAGAGANPENNYTPGRPPGSLSPYAMSQVGPRDTHRSIVEPWQSADATRFVPVPHADFERRRDY
eukprot:jgi/Mesvir1/16034/Mv08330-RA.1